MKKWIALSSILLSVPAVAQVAIGDIEGLLKAGKEVGTPAAIETEVSTARIAGLACPALRLSGAKIGRGPLSNDFDIKNGAGSIGEVDYRSDRFEIKLGGATAAKAVIAGSIATVTDCGGAVVGTVQEVEGSGSSYFVIKDAAGQIVAQSGWVDDYTFALRGAGGSATMQEDSGMLSTGWTVSTEGLDDRLAATASLMNHGAIMRRAAERRRENWADRPGRAGRE